MDTTVQVCMAQVRWPLDMSAGTPCKLHGMCDCPTTVLNTSNSYEIIRAKKARNYLLKQD